MINLITNRNGEKALNINATANRASSLTNSGWLGVPATKYNFIS